MNVEELRKWFFGKLYNCYPTKNEKYPDSIFWFYDEMYVRKIKLSRLSSKNVEFTDKITGKCLFETENKHIFLYCDYDEIWSIFYNEYNNDYGEVQKLIMGWLEEESKMRVYTPVSSLAGSLSQLEEESKMIVFTPLRSYRWSDLSLVEESKLSLYTPKVELFFKWKTSKKE